MSRILTCTRCADDVEVTEVPRQWIDPERYVCGECMTTKAEPTQLALVGGKAVGRREEPKYDPWQAALPY